MSFLVYFKSHRSFKKRASVRCVHSIQTMIPQLIYITTSIFLIWSLLVSKELSERSFFTQDTRDLSLREFKIRGRFWFVILFYRFVLTNFKEPTQHSFLSKIFNKKDKTSCVFSYGNIIIILYLLLLLLFMCL